MFSIGPPPKTPSSTVGIKAVVGTFILTFDGAYRPKRDNVASISSNVNLETMGTACTKCRSATISAIPDKTVMLEIVDRIVEFENMLKAGQSLTRAEEKEKRGLESVAREMKKVQRKEGTLVKRVSVDANI